LLTSRDCRYTLRCSKCGGRHHVSICVDSHPMAPTNIPGRDSSSRDNSQASHQGQQQPILPTTASSLPTANVTVPTSASLCCINMKAPVLLQTTRATVSYVA